MVPQSLRCNAMRLATGRDGSYSYNPQPLYEYTTIRDSKYDGYTSACRLTLACIRALLELPVNVGKWVETSNNDSSYLAQRPNGLFKARITPQISQLRLILLYGRKRTHTLFEPRAIIPLRFFESFFLFPAEIRNETRPATDVPVLYSSQSSTRP
jgi:hypothetical protein